MMGKFTPQLRGLPGAVDMASSALAEPPRPTSQIAPAVGDQTNPHPTADPDHLRAAQSLLEKEVARPDLPPADAEAVREVLFGLRERNLPRVASVFRDAFRELRTPVGSDPQSVRPPRSVLRRSAPAVVVDRTLRPTPPRSAHQHDQDHSGHESTDVRKVRDASGVLCLGNA